MKFPKLSFKRKSQESLEPKLPVNQKTMIVPIAWVSFTLLCFFFLTIIKIPHEPIQQLIENQLTLLLQEQGIGFSAKSSTLTLNRYTLNNVHFWHQNPPRSLISSVKNDPLDSLTFKAHWIPLLWGTQAGTLRLVQGKGFLEIQIHWKSPKFHLRYQAQNFDLGTTGLLSLLLNAPISGIFSGSGEISGHLKDWSIWQGQLQMEVQSLILESQTVTGFSIPKILISNLQLDLKGTPGRLQIKKFELGHLSKQDDLQASLSGHLQLEKQLTQSSLHLKINFHLSENLFKSFILLKTLLSPGQQPDGSFSFRIGGSLLKPLPQPITHQDSE